MEAEEREGTLGSDVLEERTSGGASQGEMESEGRETSASKEEGVEKGEDRPGEGVGHEKPGNSATDLRAMSEEESASNEREGSACKGEGFEVGGEHEDKKGWVKSSGNGEPCFSSDDWEFVAQTLEGGVFTERETPKPEAEGRLPEGGAEGEKNGREKENTHGLERKGMYKIVDAYTRSPKIVQNGKLLHAVAIYSYNDYI